MAKKKAAILEIPVQFGSVGFGKKTARVSASVERNEMNLGDADAQLCDRRVTAQIHAASNGDQAGQGRLPGMEDEIDINIIADVKSLKVDSGAIGFGMTVNIKGLERSTFSNLASRTGTIRITASEAIPDDKDDKDDDGDEGEVGQDEE